MSCPSYKFSKESEPDLLEFLKAVAEQNVTSLHPSETEIWQKILPVDHDILQKIAANKSSTAMEIIDITQSDDEDTNNVTSSKTTVDNHFQLPVQEFSQQALTKSKLNIGTTEDLIEGVRELLKTEHILSEEIIKQFAMDCTQQQLQEMFNLFSEDLSLECILKLWKSIAISNCIERDTVVFCFSNCILNKKIISKDHTVKELLKEMLNTLPDLVNPELVKVLHETTDVRELSIIHNNLSILSDTQCNQLLRLSLKNCKKIDVKYISTILSLMSKHSTDLDILNNVIELMYNSAKEFSLEKTFGKLIMEIMPTLGSKIIHFQHHLKYIIINHKSVYESQITKMFDTLLSEQQQNLSLTYSRMYSN